MTSFSADPEVRETPELAHVARLFDDTRKRLIETGTRNRLVHVNRANSRGNMVNIVNERSDDVYRILASPKVMRFLGIGQDKDDDDGTLRLVGGEAAGFDEARFGDNQLETRLGPDALQKKLLTIAREAETAEDESGVNILYLALGFLTWFEDKASSLPREAPLVLLPVELVRNPRTSTYEIRLRDDEVFTNLPLQQRLKEDYGIDLPDIEITDGWQPAAYFAAVDEVVAQQKRWRIDPDGMQLGFFSFSKLLMYRDLAVRAWPDGSLGSHPLVKGLLYEGFESEAPLFREGDRLDTVLPPEMLFHVVDADASQAQVIEEVRSGRNLVVQGPPGTGKSQTITNIIAAAVKEGKRVLFVAEKMAALSVVHSRLVKVGLRDVCLELHSRNASKNIVLGELARTIAAAGAASTASAAPTALREARDRLNNLTNALHSELGGTGETAFSVLSRQASYIGSDMPPPGLSCAAFTSMTREDEARLVSVIERYSQLLEAEGRGIGHPYEGARNLNLQPVELSRLAIMLQKAVSAVEAALAAIQVPVSELQLPEARSLATLAGVDRLLERLEGLPARGGPTVAKIMAYGDLPRLRETLQAGFEWQRMENELAITFADGAFDKDIAALRDPIAAGIGSLFLRFGGRYRVASQHLGSMLRTPLPKSASERLKLVDLLSTGKARDAQWRTQAQALTSALGDVWHGEEKDLGALLSVVDWCARLKDSPILGAPDRMVALATRANAATAMRRALSEAAQAIRDTAHAVIHLLDLDQAVFGTNGFGGADLGTIASLFGRMAGATGRYIAWAKLSKLHAELVAGGVEALAENMRLGRIDGSKAAVELRYARAEHLWRSAIQHNPALREISAVKRHELVATFARLEKKRLVDNVADILGGHLLQVPQGAMGEMKIVRGEIAKKRNHLPLRKLFGLAGTAVQRIKPVILMSPISVAQFLTPGTLSFDLLVIDEASQVRPEDALGAIARARQIAVVGDRKQLPPSAFFDRLSTNDGDGDGSDGQLGPDDVDLLGGAAELGSMESVLTLCEARGLGSRMLKWHYRSRDPSLMEVSNREFYEGSLILPPSPLQQDPAYGLCFSRVDGVYDRGGKRDNRKEGEAVVARVAEHARAYPSLSLGIVTFSVAQRNLVTELLEIGRRKDSVLDGFLREGQSENLFVKNIENVQGDERDVILVSVGYGPAVAGGRLTSMSFGPVNSEGGERRLNVLFSRARVRCEVFASFDPGDIDISRTAGAGPRIFKRFLDFAKNGQIDDKSPTGLGADSPLEEDVADVVRSLGFMADPQVGSAGFRVDMGIRHPDRPGVYILALECDGATYHSALWARERDRLRQDVLEHLGWRFHRIWSTDWFYNRHAEIDRLQQALVAAREAAEHGIEITGANRPQTVVEQVSDHASTMIQVPEVVARQMPAYRRAVLNVNSRQEPHEIATPIIANLAKRVIAEEGPIHVEEVARRIAACFGKERAGSRILTATRVALASAQRDQSISLTEDAFWSTREQHEKPPVRDRSAESGALLKAGSISMLEIGEALRIARDDNAGGSEADLVRTAARLLGFRRVGSELQARIAGGL